MAMLEWQNLIFVLPMLAAILYVLLMAAGLSWGGGADLDADHDVHVEVGHDVSADADHDADGHGGHGAHGGLLGHAFSLLGVGKVPLSILVLSVCLIWGATGLVLNAWRGVEAMRPNVALAAVVLQIDRTGPDALITADFLRADVKAGFYIRVQKDEKSIEQADVAQQEVVQATALAEAEAAKAIATAQAQQRAKTASAEQSRLASVAQVEADRLVELAKVEQNKAVQVANQLREQANEVAGVEKQKTVELARRAQQIAVAEAEKTRAEAEAKQLAAQREREAAAQHVKTVEVQLTAERERDKAVIARQAEVEQQRIKFQMEAEVAAYAAVKKAEGDQSAADKQAKARIALAEADKQAKSLEAEGERAVQMVPVTVAREQVNVEDARVTVKIRDLEGQSKFESIARELQVQLATIQAEKEAKIAAAQAMGAALAKANLNVWGDPGAVQQMAQAFFRGQAVGSFANGLTGSLPPAIAELVRTLTGGAAGESVQGQSGKRAAEAGAASPNGGAAGDRGGATACE